MDDEYTPPRDPADVLVASQEDQEETGPATIGFLNKPQTTDEDDEEYTSGNTSSGDSPGKSTLEENFELEHCYENGRRYANETCLYPDDEEEEIRLSITHQVHLLLLYGELTISRVPKDVKSILDIGTGPGDWAIAMGEVYPRARVIATDITMYQPTSVPPNVEFRVEDVCQEWSYDESFDFIHMRDLYTALPDFAHVYRQVARYLKPRGTFEFATGGALLLKNNYENSSLRTWTEALRKVMEELGEDCWLDYKDRESIEKSGLRIMKHVHMDVRLGEWTNDRVKRRTGRMALVACCEGIEACSLRAFNKFLGWKLEDVVQLNELVKAELMDLENEAYVEVEYYVARRFADLE